MPLLSAGAGLRSGRIAQGCVQFENLTEIAQPLWSTCSTAWLPSRYCLWRWFFLFVLYHLVSFLFQWTTVILCSPAIHLLKEPGSVSWWLPCTRGLLLGPPQIRLFSRLNKPTSLGVFSKGKCASPPSILMALHWPILKICTIVHSAHVAENRIWVGTVLFKAI